MEILPLLNKNEKVSIKRGGMKIGALDEISILKKQIAERLKLARELSGLSQLQAAKFLKISRPTISEIEAGRRNVISAEIIQFSDLYDVDTKWILGRSEESQDFAESKIQLAARELSKMSEEDVNKLLKLLAAMKKNR